MGRYRIRSRSECVINIPITVDMQLTEADYDVRLHISDIKVDREMAEFYLLNGANRRLLKNTLRYRIDSWEIVRIDNPKYAEFSRMKGLVADGIKERLLEIVFNLRG